MKLLSFLFSKYNTEEPNKWGISSRIHLDVGCGNNPRNPFDAEKLIGADILDPEFLNFARRFNYIKLDLGGKIPLETESVDSISGFDFLEHLSRGSNVESNMFILFMNEAYRILKKDGVLMLVTPAFPNPAAFQDPTHVNIITKETVNYFVGKNPSAMSLGYGFEGSFALIVQVWVGPLSKVWGNSVESTASRGKNFKALILLKISYSINSIRRTLSGIRNPSHILWLLKKV